MFPKDGLRHPKISCILSVTQSTASFQASKIPLPRISLNRGSGKQNRDVAAQHLHHLGRMARIAVELAKDAFRKGMSERISLRQRLAEALHPLTASTTTASTDTSGAAKPIQPTPYCAPLPPASNFRMISSRLKLAGFCRGGNSLKLESHLAANACIGT